MHFLLPFFILFFLAGCTESDGDSNATVPQPPDYVYPSTGPQQNNQIYTPTSTVTTKRPMLVIAIDFTDYQFKSPIVNWENKIFGHDPKQLNNYYNEISHDQFQFEPVNNGSVPNGIAKVQISQDHPNFYSGNDSNLWQNDITQRLYPILSEALTKLDTDDFDWE